MSFIIFSGLSMRGFILLTDIGGHWLKLNPSFIFRYGHPDIFIFSKIFSPLSISLSSVEIGLQSILDSYVSLCTVMS